MGKSARNKNLMLFKDKYLGLIALEYDVSDESESGRYKIFGTDYGIIDYYPKADKIHIHEGNQWKQGGLNWIKKNLIK